MYACMYFNHIKSKLYTTFRVKYRWVPETYTAYKEVKSSCCRGYAGPNCKGIAVPIERLFIVAYN